MQLLEQFESARRRSVPILAIRTADQAATAATIINFSDLHKHPVVQWDAARGITPTGPRVPKKGGKAGEYENTPARQRSEDALAEAKVDGPSTLRFASAMVAAERLPPNTVLLVHNAHRQLSGTDVATASHLQGVANLRNLYKQNFRMLALLSHGFTVPTEIEHDVVTIAHELPDDTALGTIVDRLYASAQAGTPGMPALDADVRTRAIDALSGLSDFAAEQAFVLALTEHGLDMSRLWAQKRALIENTRGLKVYTGGDRFADIAGYDYVKARLLARKHARQRIGVVVWVDEGSDAMAMAEHDTSGVQQDQQRVLLTAMENKGWKGMIMTGVAGAGKSALSRAVGNEFDVPTIELDLGALEAGIVGESQQHVRHAIDVIDRVGRGSAFFLFTCNTLKGVRPQFQRRFKKGTFFFDMPADAERAAIWRLYVAKYELAPEQLAGLPGLPGGIADDGWTGAEIRECVEEAWDTGCSIAESAQHIVPLSVSRGQDLLEMRRAANGLYLDASRGGPYRYHKQHAVEDHVRAISLGSPSSLAAEPALPS
jgi:hypothetical protein